MRLRLTASSLGRLREPEPEHEGDLDRDASPVLAARADRLAGWYGELAGSLTGPPGRASDEPSAAAPEAGQPAGASVHDGVSSGQPGGVWVALHLDHLQSHLPDVLEPARRAASLRRRPWWR
jgi:hypothetical protein